MPRDSTFNVVIDSYCPLLNTAGGSGIYRPRSAPSLAFLGCRAPETP